MDKYEEALKIFGIDSGFVHTNLDDIYARLKAETNPDVFKFLSPEYMDMSRKQSEITNAYYRLDSIFKNYIIKGSENRETDCEKLEDDIFKLLYDSIKGKKEIDEVFISSLVETMVINLGLNSYVRRIEFQYRDKNAYASYTGQDNHLIVFLNSILDFIRISYDDDFNSAERESHPYYQVIAIMRHEVEHAFQKYLREQNGNDIYTKLSVMKEVLSKKRDQELDRIVRYPIVLYPGALLIRSIKLNRDYKKYSKNWRFVPTERMADIKAYNLVLNLLRRTSKENSNPIPILEERFQDELHITIISGYDKDPFPAITYFEKIGQYEDCLELIELSKTLSLEERLAFGLSITGEERNSFLQDSSKVMQKIRTM